MITYVVILTTPVSCRSTISILLINLFFIFINAINLYSLLLISSLISFIKLFSISLLKSLCNKMSPPENRFSRMIKERQALIVALSDKRFPLKRRSSYSDRGVNYKLESWTLKWLMSFWYCKVKLGIHNIIWSVSFCFS